MSEPPLAPSHVLLANLCGDLHLTGNIAEDVSAFLRHHHHPQTALHCQHVATAARDVAIATQANPSQTHIAGWLHDVSAISLPVSGCRSRVPSTLRCLPKKTTAR